MRISAIVSIILLPVALCHLAACTEPTDLVPEQPTDFCSRIHMENPVRLSEVLRPYDSMIKKETGCYVLEDGGSSLVTRAWLCEHAEKSIDIQYFIFSTDNVGLIACDYLVRAADRGVHVRILVDDMMIENHIHEILTLDSHPNIEIRVYNPGVNLGKNMFGKLKKFAQDFRGANQRMHNKVLIVDQQVGITGGRNIADEYFDYDHTYNFRDRDVLLLGRVLPSMTASFETFWKYTFSVPVNNVITDRHIDASDATRFDRLHAYACNPENFWPQIREQIQQLHHTFQAIQRSGGLFWSDHVQFISDIPGKNDGLQGIAGGGRTTDSLIHLVQNATHAIDIQSPYLVTTSLGLDLFKAAVARGVTIRILTNSLASTDNVEAFSGYQRVREKLLDAGVHIYEFKPDAAERVKMATGALQKKLTYMPVFGLHAKSMVIDGRVTVIGTFNLDPRSANLNTECFALIDAEPLAKTVLKGMEEEYKPENAWEITKAFNPDHLVGKWKQAKTIVSRAIPKGIL